MLSLNVLIGLEKNYPSEKVIGNVYENDDEKEWICYEKIVVDFG